MTIKNHLLAIFAFSSCAMCAGAQTAQIVGAPVANPELSAFEQSLNDKLSQHLSAHLWSEFQFPGDYYVYRQPWSFLRAEVLLTF